MKNKKLLIVLIIICIVMSVLSVVCGIINLTTANNKSPKSAYDIAVDNGFKGTQEEWLESLKGKDGNDGINGKDGLDGQDGKNGTNGKDGLNGVNGKDGVNGQDGVNGKDGLNGKDGVNGLNGKDGENGKNAEVQSNTPVLAEHWVTKKIEIPVNGLVTLYSNYTGNITKIEYFNNINNTLMFLVENLDFLRPNFNYQYKDRLDSIILRTDRIKNITKIEFTPTKTLSNSSFGAIKDCIVYQGGKNPTPTDRASIRLINGQTNKFPELYEINKTSYTFETPINQMEITGVEFVNKITIYCDVLEPYIEMK